MCKNRSFWHIEPAWPFKSTNAEHENKRTPPTKTNGTGERHHSNRILLGILPVALQSDVSRTAERWALQQLKPWNENILHRWILLLPLSEPGTYGSIHVKPVLFLHLKSIAVVLKNSKSVPNPAHHRTRRDRAKRSISAAPHTPHYDRPTGHL